MLAIPSDELAQLFGATFAPGAESGYVPSFNIPPTSEVLALAEADDGGRIFDLYRWGLVPSWTKDPAGGPPMHNARSETVATKPSFRAAFTSRRVGVVAQGYFEWRRTPGTKLQPFYIHRADGAPLTFASLSESWARGEQAIRSTAIVTTQAGEDTRALHDRMPVVLEPDTLAVWLDRTERDREVLGSILRPALQGTLIAHPVDPRVGKVSEDDAELLREVSLDDEPSPAVPLTLF